MIDFLSNMIAAIIGAWATWIGIKHQEQRASEKELKNKQAQLIFQLHEQINLCEELKAIRLNKEGALESDLFQLNQLWESLYRYRHECDFAILDYNKNSELMRGSLQKWQKLWNQYEQTYKSINFTKNSSNGKIDILQKSKQKFDNALDDYCYNLKDMLKQVEY